MKRMFLFAIMVFTFLFISACASSRLVDDNMEEDQKEQNRQEVVLEHALSLTDYLFRLPGVFVDERTNPPIITVRGGRPLFVVDGVPVGNSYASVVNAVNVFDIHSVEILKNPTETVIYGKRAAHGVILIKTFLRASTKKEKKI